MGTTRPFAEAMRTALRAATPIELEHQTVLDCIDSGDARAIPEEELFTLALGSSLKAVPRAFLRSAGLQE